MKRELTPEEIKAQVESLIKEEDTKRKYVSTLSSKITALENEIKDLHNQIEAKKQEKIKVEVQKTDPKQELQLKDFEAIEKRLDSLAQALDIREKRLEEGTHELKNKVKIETAILKDKEEKIEKAVEDIAIQRQKLRDKDSELTLKEQQIKEAQDKVDKELSKLAEQHRDYANKIILSENSININQELNKKLTEKINEYDQKILGLNQKEQELKEKQEYLEDEAIRIHALNEKVERKIEIANLKGIK